MNRFISSFKFTPNLRNVILNNNNNSRFVNKLTPSSSSYYNNSSIGSIGSSKSINNTINNNSIRKSSIYFNKCYYSSSTTNNNNNNNNNNGINVDNQSNDVSNSIEDQFNSIDALIDQDQYDQALVKINQLLETGKLHNDDVFTMNLTKAKICQALGKYQESLDVYQSLLNSHPLISESIDMKLYVMEHMVPLLSELQRYQEAIDLMVQALERKVRIDYYITIGNLYLFKLQQPQDAEQWFEKALELNGEDILSLFGHGETMIYQNEPMKAIESFEKVVNIIKHRWEEKEKESQLLKEDGTVDRNQLLDIDRIYLDSKSRLGLITLKLMDLKKAMEHYKDVLEICKGKSPYKEIALMHIASCSVATGEFESALSYIDIILKDDKIELDDQGRTSIDLMMFNSYKGLKRYDDALEKYSEVIEGLSKMEGRMMDRLSVAVSAIPTFVAAIANTPNVMAITNNCVPEILKSIDRMSNGQVKSLRELNSFAKKWILAITTFKEQEMLKMVHPNDMHNTTQFLRKLVFLYNVFEETADYLEYYTPTSPDQIEGINNLSQRIVEEYNKLHSNYNNNNNNSDNNNTTNDGIL